MQARSAPRTDAPTSVRSLDATRAAAQARAVIDEYSRLRADLARSMAQDDLFLAEATAGVAGDMSPWRQRYRMHQRSLEERIGPLRARVRDALSHASPALGRLAALDAVLDRALAAHERQLLSALPAWLDRSADAQADSAPPPDPLGSGLALRDALRAELDLRLLPVEGMIAALGEAIHSTPGTPA